ncbi:DUF7219 family protein [Rhodopirellula bahusiensis]|uniref:DUF7219 family protein n=1 Tax=Rhodopirellula bahusiensis TaxID=2014065 RepID=UPI003266CCF5
MNQEERPTDHEDSAFAEKMLFEANLQEFASRVGFICGLESQHKLTQEDAYDRIKQLWKELKRSRKNLNIGKDIEER